jgi:hypothetical protein
MRIVNIPEDDEVRDFAKKAAMFFAKHEKYYTFSYLGKIEAGELFAVRFGLDDDCVVVFRIDEGFEPINYQQLITKYVGE